MSFSDKINVTLPPDRGEKTTLGASRIRSLKRAICERLSGLVYGFKSDDTESDETKQGFWKVSLNKLTSSPTHEQDKGIVYVKEVDGKVELFYKDSSGNEKQITSEGKLNLSGDQTIAGVKTFSSFPITPSSAPSSDYQVANKKYVDDNTTADDTTIEKASGVLRVKDSGISQAKLKTATQEISRSGGVGTYVLTGGDYTLGFVTKYSGSYEENYHANIGQEYDFYSISNRISTSYVARMELACGDGSTIYAQIRYITSSGTDYWLFLLVDKETKEVISGYSAPDHPAYGNGGDFNKVPHPFLDYDETKHEIILVDQETIAELKAQITEEKSLLALINEFYKPDMTKEEVYKPLHSGKYINKSNQQVKELVTELPSYIKVRKLIKLTPEELTERENKKQLALQQVEQRKQEKQNKLNALKRKLNLTDEELELLKDALK